MPDVRNRAQLNEAEAANILKVLTKYFGGEPDPGLAPFDLPWSYQLHREMFGEVWSWAGQKRNTELNLGIPAHRIDTDLYGLLQDLKYWDGPGNMDTAEQAARLHHRAVQIHPFLNGNGRWSRMLANIWMFMHGRHIVAWPEQVIGSSSVVRNEYLDAIRAADRGELTPLLNMQKRYETPVE